MEKEKRLIDANALIEKLQEAVTHKGMGAAIAGILIRYIEKLPTVDAVEVVRCRDCKWAGAYVDSDGKEWVDCTYHHNALFYKDDFCSHGQRRAE